LNIRNAGRRTFVALVLLLSLQGSPSGQVQTFEGTLTIIWGDPSPGSTVVPATRYTLVLPDGREARLQISGREASLADSLYMRPVTVTGQLLQGDAALAADPLDAGAIAVSSIAPSTRAATPGDGVAIQAAATGQKKVIYLLAKFPEDASVPHPPSFYLELNNGNVPPPGSLVPATINGFFKKASWNQLEWIGDVGGVGGVGAPGGWLTLPYTRSQYFGCSSGCAQGAIEDHAMAEGRAQGINFALYDQVNFVFSNDIGGAFGGGRFSQIEGKFLGMTWIGPDGQEPWVYAHEFGHSLGLQHTGWVYYPYDSPWDAMSGGMIGPTTLACGSYLKALNGYMPTPLWCREPGSSFIAEYTENLGWLPPSNIVVTDTVTPATVTLEALSAPLGAAAKMIKICLPGFVCSGPPGPPTIRRYLTIEARVRGLGATSQYDNGLPGDGVIVQLVGQNLPSGPCNRDGEWPLIAPIDATSGDYDFSTCPRGPRFAPSPPNWGLYNAQLLEGQSLSIPTAGIRVDVTSRTGSSYTVSIVPLPIPAITGSPADALITAGQTATFTVVASSATPLTYQWYMGEKGITTRPIAGATSSSYMTPPRQATSRYWVRVTNSFASSDSTSARAIVMFSDNTLVPGATPIRAIHVIELRSRVDALRLRFGLPTPYNWNTPVLTPGISTISGDEVRQLRNALLETSNAASAPFPIFTDPVAVGIVKALHFDELRSVVHNLEER
jgi:hypothetical protein